MNYYNNNSQFMQDGMHRNMNELQRSQTYNINHGYNFPGNGMI